MQALAPLVAAKSASPRPTTGVLAELKKRTIPNDQLEAHYAEVLGQIEQIAARERIVTLPDRPMQMRLGQRRPRTPRNRRRTSSPPPLIGNTGEQGTFVLTARQSERRARRPRYDDFNYPAGGVDADRARRPARATSCSSPRMVERGVSLARTLFAFNSVNVEGWALYAEAETLPYEPLEGQLIALQLRLLRAARAMLDPMLNLGPDRPRHRVRRAHRGGRICRRRWRGRRSTATRSIRRARPAVYFYGYSRIHAAARGDRGRARRPSSTARRSTTSCSTRDCCRRTCWPRRCARSSCRRSRRSNRGKVPRPLAGGESRNPRLLSPHTTRPAPRTPAWACPVSLIRPLRFQPSCTPASWRRGDRKSLRIHGDIPASVGMRRAIASVAR